MTDEVKVTQEDDALIAAKYEIRRALGSIKMTPDDVLAITYNVNRKRNFTHQIEKWIVDAVWQEIPHHGMLFSKLEPTLDAAISNIIATQQAEIERLRALVEGAGDLEIEGEADD